MATLKRTFISRGKAEIEAANMKPNGIYAVEYTVTAGYAAANGLDKQDQWGIIQLDHTGKVRRHWNVTTPKMWSSEPLEDLKDMHVWKSSDMERQFAWATDEVNSLTIKQQQLLAKNSSQLKRIGYFEQNRWHKIAERLNTFFS